VTSEETRLHLKDAHQRVLSVAEVQSHLHASGDIDQIEVGAYLTKLCASLAASMVSDSRPIALEVVADHGLIGSDKAVGIGLIVTELVINAIKYAFPVARTDARITVTFDGAGPTGRSPFPTTGSARRKRTVGASGGGLGTVIVKALVKQLDANMTVEIADGMHISIGNKPAPPARGSGLTIVCLGPW
jgi:two-component sensor histidine kinase